MGISVRGDDAIRATRWVPTESAGDDGLAAKGMYAVGDMVYPNVLTSGPSMYQGEKHVAGSDEGAAAPLHDEPFHREPSSVCGAACHEACTDMTYRGSGQGEYLQEVTYKYVGSGGDFHRSRPRWCSSCPLLSGGLCVALLLAPLLCWWWLRPPGGAPEKPNVDCAYGVDAWNTLWSEEKKQYCCTLVGVACRSSTAPGVQLPTAPEAAAASQPLRPRSQDRQSVSERRPQAASALRGHMPTVVSDSASHTSVAAASAALASPVAKATRRPAAMREEEPRQEQQRTFACDLRRASHWSEGEKAYCCQKIPQSCP